MRGLIVLLGLLLTTPVLAADWIEALDIPLMPGLYLNAEDATVFETATGRVIVAEASTALASGAVRRYYADALPGLGWVASDDRTYLRENERLKIEISGSSGDILIAFRLAPK